MAEVEIISDGFVVDASVLAEAFGLAPPDVPTLMRQGAIRSRCETGTGDDVGRWRLTFFHAGRALRLTVDASGTVLQRARFAAPDRAGRARSKD